MTDERHLDCDDINVRAPAGYRGQVVPVTVRLPDTTAQTLANYTTPFFIADRDYEVLYAIERHEVAGGFPLPSISLYKVPSGVATAAGTDILLGAFFTNSAADTNVKLMADQSVAHLKAGDALALYPNFGFDPVEGVTVTVIMRAV